jgi:zinc protease
MQPSKTGGLSMSHLRKVITILIIAFSFALPAWARAERDISKTTLENGLTVILEEDHSAPVVAFQMWVKVGSADENENEAGIAHVFEHMLFKGTEKRGLGDIAREVEGAGGDINAYTSYDNTVYFLAVPSRNFSSGLDVISDAIQNSAFDPVELEKELEVVLEEIRRGEDVPGRKLFKKLLSTAYTLHPYKRPVIGFEKTVRALTRDYILDFFKKWYVPNNMTLVVVGDFDKDNALSEIKTSFKEFKKNPDPHTPRPVEPSQRQTRAAILSEQITETHLSLAFHIPELKHEDTYAMDVLAIVLGQGAGSRLYKKLKIENELVHSISASAMTPKEPGIFFIDATLEAKNAEKTLEEIKGEIERLAYEGPDSAELENAKINLESEFIYSRESMQGKASQLGYYETISGDLAFEKKYVEGIRKVTSADIKSVIGRYLDSDNMTVAVLLPEKEKGVLTEKGLIELVKRSEEKARKTYAKALETGDITKVKLENGITLIVKEDHSNETVAFYASFPGGLRYETPATNGLGNFIAGMLTRGTEKRTREELVRELEGMAGGIGGFSGRNTTGVSAKFLSRNFHKGLEILADVIANPTFPEDEIEKLRKDILASIKRQEDNLTGYTFKLLQKTLYKEHPYGMPASGEVETVSAFTREDLISHYKKVLVPERMVFAIVGDINKDRAIEKVKEVFKDFKGKADVQEPVLPMEERQKDIRTTGDVKEKAQTNIGIGFFGTTILGEDRYAMSILSGVLSSQGGRLFVELRDKLSLAYAVGAFSRSGVEPGIFAVYIGCAPEKKDEAIDGIMRELKKVITEKITEEEIQRAKNALVGGYEIGLQNVSSQASDMANNELFGLGHDYFQRYPAKIEAVTGEDILNIARKYITLDAYTISIVGPQVVN